MLKFFLLFLISFGAFAQGDLSGNLRSQGAPSVANNFGKLQVPNFQATKTGAVDALIETGNKNLLRNSGFEHQTYSTGWTTSGTATYSAETSAPLSGLKSFKAVATAQTIDLVQDTTLYASARAGSQMFWRFSAKNTAAGVTACVRKNGVKQTGSNDCLTLATDGVTRTYELAFLANGTSNGIEIDAASTTGTLIVDDVELSTESSAFVDVAQIGPWINYGAISTPTATTTSPTKGGTRPTDSVRCRVSGQDYECEYRYYQTSAGTAGSGGYIFSLPAGLEIDTSVHPTLANQSASAYNADLGFQSIGTGTTQVSGGGTTNIKGTIVPTSSTTFQLFGLYNAINLYVMGSSFSNFGAAAMSFEFNIKFRGKGLSNKVSTYSQFAVSDVSVENVFSAKVSAAGVVSDESLDWISGNCSGSSPYTCTFNSGIFTIAPNCTITNTTDGGGYFSAGSPSASSFIYRTILTTNGATTNIPFIVTCTKQGADFKAKNVITGSFQGIEKCADPYECTDTFSAKVSDTGVVSAENLEWLNGNCTYGSGQWTCNFNSSVFSVAPNCTATRVLNGIAGYLAINTTSTTSVTVDTRNTAAAQVQAAFNLTCQKQGVDFRPKTAVAGTFLDSVTSPGAGKVSLCSAKISSTGVISDQIGGCFASCTNATTPVCTFTSNYWVSGSIPNCWHTSSSGNFMGGIATTTTTFAGLTLSGAGTPQAGSRDYFCTGLRP